MTENAEKTPLEELEALGRHRPPPPPKLDPEQARMTFNAILATFVQDGVIDQTEMMILSQQLVTLGLVSSPEEVPDFVQKELEKSHPEVYIE